MSTQSRKNFAQALMNMMVLCALAFGISFGVGFCVMNAYAPNDMRTLISAGLASGVGGFTVAALVCVGLYQHFNR
jgi:hypothetical protein